MDSDAERIHGNMRIPGKRRWSSELPAQSQHSVNNAAIPGGRPQPSAHPDGSEPKRPRLATVTPGHIRVDHLKAVSQHLSTRLGDLPPEILQHIFCFVDPISLGRLIRVNHSFRALIDPAVTLPQVSGQVGHLTLRNQDLVWAISRKMFFQGCPRPMDGMSELEMWRLALGQRCQYCGLEPRQGGLSLPTLSPWNAGPGTENVRTIWPFRVRSCAKCLEPRLIKETDLIITGSSALLPGLPFTIFTPNLDYVPSVTLRQKSPPVGLQLTKFYFKAQLEELQRRRDNVRTLGIAALEEWYKGLDDLGQQHDAAAARFEQWDFQGSLRKTPVTESRHASHVAFSSDEAGFHQRERTLLHDFQLKGNPPIFSLGNISSNSLNSGADPHGTPVTHFQQMGRDTNASPYYAIGKLPPKMENGIGSVPTRPPRHRVERSLKEVEQIKADRRKEIERRCLALDPPLMPSTLTYMKAFKAAILISQPLNDKAWDTLRPRLLAQRMEAEQKESMHNPSLSNAAMPLEGLRLLEEEQRVAQANVSHMWLELKVPSRDKIQKYAQDFIHQTWSDGRGVTRATASKFAAEVLCHVRQRFDEVIAQEDRMLALKGTAFPQDTDSQACRRLKLEDMKWTFEQWIKPHTERFGKDLFLCRVCDTNHKLFSFEAVIQHYAAKHTSALSHGNAVVYWKAPWPVDPPFDPAPNIPWAQEGLYTGGRPASSSVTPLNAGYRGSGSFQRQSDVAAALAVDFWHRLDGIRDLSDPVRLYVVIQHTNLGFWREFSDELNLPIFTDVVSRQPELQSLRDLLQCKLCSELTGMIPAQSNGRIRRLYSLMELLSHFQQLHLEAEPASVEAGRASLSSGVPRRANWKRDMIWLPSPAAIQALLHSPGIDRDNLQILVEAFPNFFPPVPPQPPQLRQVEHQVSLADNVHSMERKGHYIGRGSVRGSGTGSHIATSEESGITADDEYDPHCPAPTFTRPYSQETRFTMTPFPREGARYRELSYYPTEPPVYRHYHSRDADSGRAWDLHSTDGPLSGASAVYSHEGGSSRYSYVESYNRSSATTVEGASAAEIESKAASRQSLPSAVNTEAPRHVRNTGDQLSTGDELVSWEAMGFLNNFNPTSAEDATAPATEAGALPMHYPDQKRVGFTKPPPMHSQDNRPSFRRGGRRINDHPNAYLGASPSLPIRLSVRPDRGSESYPMLTGPGSIDLKGHGTGTPRVLLADRSLAEESHRIPFQPTSSTLEDRAAPYTGPQYEIRYFSEDDRYDRSVESYGVIESGPTASSARVIDRRQRRHLEDQNLERQGEVDNWHRAASHEDFARAAHNDYSHAGEGHPTDSEFPSGRYIEYRRYDDRYVSEGRFASRQRLVAVTDSNRELVYEPLDPPAPHGPR